jgi:glycosyltransferase involved in cell wall biosynthesis
MPSLSEGLGTAALEAMFMGCPVVFSAAGGLKDLAGPEIPTVEPGDVAELASEMIRLLNDEGARSSLSRQAQERSASFTTERTTGSTLELYRQLAGTS